MPPGNSNNKSTVTDKCSYCGKSSCKGESSHFIYSRPGNARFPAVAGNTQYPYRKNLQDESTNERPNVPISSVYNSNKNDNTSSSSTSSCPPSQKKVVLQDQLKTTGTTSANQNEPTTVGLRVNSSICGIDSDTSSYQPKETLVSVNDKTNSVVYTSFCQTRSENDHSEVKESSEDVTRPLKKVDETKTSPVLNTVLDVSKDHFTHSVPIKANDCEIPKPTTQYSDIKREELLESKEVKKISCDSPKDADEYQSSVNDAENLKFTQKKHSKKAVIYEGVVVTLGTRTAKIRVCDMGEEPKFVQLFVENLLTSGKKCYSSETDIFSVLHLGDIVKMVCTNHNRKDSGFHLFAHGAWKTDSRNLPNSNYDTESVASYVSHGSTPGSESGSKSTRRRRRKRGNVKQVDCDPNGLSDAIYQWLDQNESMNLNKNPSKSTLLEGWEFDGRVYELRLPYAFVVEISPERQNEYVFVFSKYFHPNGPDSQSVASGTSIKNLVKVGDEVTVVPVRNLPLKQGKFEWVARKAWLKRKNLESEHSAIAEMQNFSKQLYEGCIESQLLGSMDVSNSNNGNGQDGAILTLQSTWGLVKDLESGSIYVFTRKNAYLFGLCLKNFVLDDVLCEGQLVKFSQEGGECETMDVGMLYCGNPLPDFNSFTKALYKYCQERQTKSSIETSLVNLGEEFYRNK